MMRRLLVRNTAVRKSRETAIAPREISGGSRPKTASRVW